MRERIPHTGHNAEAGTGWFYSVESDTALLLRAEAVHEDIHTFKKANIMFYHITCHIRVSTAAAVSSNL